MHRPDLFSAPTLKRLSRITQFEIQASESIDIGVRPWQWWVPSFLHDLQVPFTLQPEVFKAEALKVWKGTISFE